MSINRQVDTIYKEYTWAQYQDDIQYLALTLTLNNFKPDLIIGLTRGGAIPAVSLSHIVNTDVVFKSPKELTKDTLLEIINSRTRVLFVDEIVDSGKTFHNISQMVNEMNLLTNQFKFASLIYDVQAIFKPDFYVRTVSKQNINYWVIFPWEAGLVKTL